MTLVRLTEQPARSTTVIGTPIKGLCNHLLLSLRPSMGLRLFKISRRLLSAATRGVPLVEMKSAIGAGLSERLSRHVQPLIEDQEN